MQMASISTSENDLTGLRYNSNNVTGSNSARSTNIKSCYKSSLEKAISLHDVKTNDNEGHMALFPTSSDANAATTDTDAATMKDLKERVKLRSMMISSPSSLSATVPTLASSTSNSNSDLPLSLSLTTEPLVSSLSSKSMEDTGTGVDISSSNNSKSDSNSNSPSSSANVSPASKLRLRLTETLETTLESTMESPSTEQDVHVTKVPIEEEHKLKEAVKAVTQQTQKLKKKSSKKGFKRIKLTILDLTGIKVSTAVDDSSHHSISSSYNNHRHSYQQQQHHQPLHSNLAISAMVSFTGSCDPQDMHVVSSRLCSISERLVVESKPVVVPYGMTDSLVAVWSDKMDDSTYNSNGNLNHNSTITTPNSSNTLQSSSITPPEGQQQASLCCSSSKSCSSSTSSTPSLNPDQSSFFLSSRNSNLYGKEKGSILLAEAKSVLPHLFVAVQDKSSSKPRSLNVSLADSLDDCQVPSYCDPTNEELDHDDNCHNDDYDPHDNNIENHIHHNSSHINTHYLSHPSSTSSALSSSFHSTNATGHSNAPDLDSTETGSSHNRNKDFESNMSQFVHQKKAFLGQGNTCNGTTGAKPLKASTVTAPRSVRNVTHVHNTSLPEESPVHLPVDGNSYKQQHQSTKDAKPYKKNQSKKKKRMNTTPPIREVYDTNKIEQNQDLYLSPQTIGNMNSAFDETVETPVPEILEFNVALHIQQIPSNTTHNNDGGIDDEINVKSSCSPSYIGGGAVAHLLLFPDVMNTSDSKDGVNLTSKATSSTSTSTNSRILELPVRKKNLPFYRSNASSVSGLTSRCPSTSSSRQRQEARQFYQDDTDAWVDLDDDAMIRIQLQECTEEDDLTLETENRIVTTHPRFCADASLTHNTRDKEKNPVRFKTPEGKLKNSANQVGKLMDLERGPQFVQDIKSASQEPQADESAICDEDNPKLTKEGKTRASLVEKDLPEDKNELLMSCNAFRIENLMRMFSGIIANCGEDVDLYSPAGNHSMDSTIQTLF